MGGWEVEEVEEVEEVKIRLLDWADGCAEVLRN